MPQLGPAEILVVLVIALLVFGPKRLPEVGRQVGRGLKELRKLQDTIRDEINDVLHSDEPTSASTPATAAIEPSRTSGVPAIVTGRPAPSRFRPAITAGAASAATASSSEADAAIASPQTGPPSAGPSASAGSQSAHPLGAHAPSRFRAPLAK